MECLYVTPKEQSLLECYKLIGSLNNLPPVKVQALLQA
ncbi:type IV toxin-antitoxin system AbiEi family antitoxin domain-containing protein [Tunicatimonas pelagia]